MQFSGVSAVWLAHLLWEQRVGGSNPSRPTNFFFFIKTPMKKISLLAVLAVSVLSLAASTLSAATKIACIGDSITFGYLIPTRNADNYPKRLGELLGAEFEVRNFGNPGKTCGDYPSQKNRRRWLGDNTEHKNAVEWQADAYICNLGINDTGAWWDEKLFVSGYEKLIDAWLGGRKNVALMMWTKLAPDFRGPDGKKTFPGNVYLPEFSFPKQDNGSAKNRPAAEKLLAKIAKKYKAHGIDAYSPLAGHPEFYLPDGLHPNALGAKRLAEMTFAELVKADFPQIKIPQGKPQLVPAKDGKSITLKNKGEVAILLDGAALRYGKAAFVFENATVIPPKGEIVVALGGAQDRKDPAAPLVSAQLKRAAGIKYVPAK